MNKKPQKTFNEAMSHFLAPLNTFPWYTQPIAQSFVIVATWGVGATLSALLDPPPLLAYTVAGAVITGLCIWRARTEQLGDVNWATAPTLAESCANLSPATMGAVRQVMTEALHNYPAISAVHLYLPDGADGKVLKGNIGVMPNGRRRIIMADPVTVEALSPEQFEAVLRHEMRHTTGVMHHWSLLEFSLRMTGWFAVGLLGYGWWGIVALWALLASLKWIGELVCDAASVTYVGKDPLISALEVAMAVRGRRRPWMRVVRLLLITLFPTHPPLFMRRAFASVVAAATR